MPLVTAGERLLERLGLVLRLLELLHRERLRHVPARLVRPVRVRERALPLVEPCT